MFVVLSNHIPYTTIDKASISSREKGGSVKIFFDIFVKNFSLEIYYQFSLVLLVWRITQNIINKP